MEENVNEVIEENQTINTTETVEEVKEETAVTEESQWEELPWNKNERYIPTEYQIINYRQSWKKCHCGRQTWFNDNFCPACGQRLGRPSMDE